MKFNCDAPVDWLVGVIRAREERITNWHRWFAWYPVRLSHGDCRWLEVFSRRGVYGGPGGTALPTNTSK